MCGTFKDEMTRLLSWLAGIEALVLLLEHEENDSGNPNQGIDAKPGVEEARDTKGRHEER
jgi:hypothetical protein